MRTISLYELIQEVPDIFQGPRDLLNTIEITGISADPKRCQPGFLYVADESETVDSERYGVRLDGRDFIDVAIAHGAVAVLTTPKVPVQEGAIFIFHQTPLSLLGLLYKRFLDSPYPKHIALVTGTNGKTSTVNFCQMLWGHAQKPSCAIGNLGGVCTDGVIVWGRDPVLSVPETVSLHQILILVKDKKIDYVAMEATSHSLFYHRLTGVPASIGAFTNLTRDHLDFHGSMENYFRAKMRLFEEVLTPGSFAILNADADWYEQARAICTKYNHKIISFGKKGQEIKLVNCETVSTGQDLILEIYGQQYCTHLNLFGLFQISNVLCSLGIIIAAGMSPKKAVAAIPLLTEVEGRLNTVGFTPAGGRVVVDYAHTPDGIRAALEACRSFTEEKLTIIFGGSSECDIGKRQQIGELSNLLSDQLIITDSHPWNEDPGLIRADIRKGALNALEIPDRAKAIETACKQLRKGDTLLIAGLGHERFRCVGNEMIPYSDIDTAKQIIGKM